MPPPEDLIKLGKSQLNAAVKQAAGDSLKDALPCCGGSAGDAPPRSLAELRSKGAGWLTVVLRDAGVFGPNTKITKVEVQKIDAGQTSSAARVKLTYDGSSSGPPRPSQVGVEVSPQSEQKVGPPSPPPSVFVKISRRDLEGRVLNSLMGLYRECNHYKDTLVGLGLPVPRCYFAHVHPTSKDFVLVLSDESYIEGLGYVETNTVGHETLIPSLRKSTKKEKAEAAKCHYSVVPKFDEPLAFIDPEKMEWCASVVKQALTQLAKVHAKYWRDESLFEKDLNMTKIEHFAQVQAMLEDDWKKTKKKVRSGKFEGTSIWRGVKDPTAFEEQLEGIFYHFLRDWAKRKGLEKDAWRTAFGNDEYRESLRVGGFTLTHGDFHCENLLFRHIPSRGGTDTQTGTSNGSSEGPPTEAPELVILDWQGMAVGDPTEDVVGSMVFAGFDFVGKRKYEREIVRTWWEALIANGVPEEDYPFDLAWAIYRYNYGVIMAVTLMFANGVKFFEDGGFYYRLATDQFHEYLDAHGDPRKAFDEIREIMRRMGRNVDG